MKWSNLIALGMGLSATVILTISMFLIHFGAIVSFVEDSFLIRFIEIAFGLFSIPILIKLMIREIKSSDKTASKKKDKGVRK